MNEPQNGGKGRYTIISADCHAGGNMTAYEEYLDPAWRDEFDAWRGAYRNPYRDLQDDGRSRNWDDDRRLSEQYADGDRGRDHLPQHRPALLPDRRAGGPPPVGSSPTTSAGSRGSQPTTAGCGTGAPATPTSAAACPRYSPRT